MIHSQQTFQKMALKVHAHKGKRITTMGKSGVTDVAAENLDEYENVPNAELTNTIQALERRIADLKSRQAGAKAQDQAAEDGELLEDDEDDISDEVAALTNKFRRSHGPKNAALMAVRRVLEKRSGRVRQSSVAKSDGSSFTREVQAIQNRDGISKMAAMTKARQEQPGLFMLYQMGADLKR
jgi:hypothetical protein